MITQRGGRGLYKSARRALTSQIWLDGRPFENSFYTVWNFRKKELAISLLHDMATKTKPVSLVQQFDELMACADILCVGNENSKLLSTRVVPKILFIILFSLSLSLSPVFTEFVGHQMTMHTKLTGEIAKLKVG